MKIKNKLIYPLILIIIAILSLTFKYFISGNRTGINILKHNSETSQTTLTNSDTQNTSSTTIENTLETSIAIAKCQVYICGAINNPGIYEVNTGEILNSIIEKSGNFTDDAAQTRINLVYQISSNMTIYIPTNKELDSNTYDSNLNQEGIIIGTTNNTLAQNNAENPSVSSNNSTLININKASESELSSLPGIGPSLAQKIIKYREKQPFKNKDDLMNVSGIGNAKFNNLKDLICT